jgi:putative inorganic carbon (HCO3(-)) transporter
MTSELAVRRRTLVLAALPAGAAALALFVMTNPRIAEDAIGRATPLLLLAALGFGVLTIRYSAAGVPLLVALVYLNLSEILVRYHDFPSVLQLVVVALAFAAWLKRDTAEPAAVISQPLVLALLAYLLYAFVSTSWAGDQRAADDRVMALGRAFLLFLIATFLMTNRARLRQGVHTLVASGALVGAFAVVQAATGRYESHFGGMARLKQAHIYGEVFEARAAGPIGDPNFFAQILLLVIPLGAMLAMRESVRWRRLAFLAATFLVTVTLLLTYSRGAIIALGVVVLMLLAAFHVRWSTTALGAALVIGIFILLPPTITQRIVTIEEILPSREAPVDPDSSFAERRLLMSVAWKMFTANPVAGVGIGNYSAAYEDYVGLVSSEAREYPSGSPDRYPHNLALELGAEGGVLGLLLFAALIVACWRSLRRVEQGEDAELSTMARALRIGLAGFLVAGLFLHLGVPRHLLLLFAFAASLERAALPARGPAS